MITTTTQKPITRRARFALRTVYAAGFAGTGYGLWELFSGPGKMNPIAALGPVILIELFAVTASTYSTRARVRGEGGFFIRNVVGLGALASAAMQFGFHIADNPVIAIGLPLVSVLALVLWILDVRDQYAAIFRAQLEERQARRRERRARIVGLTSYAYANGLKATHREWKARVAEVGSVSRDVDRLTVLAEINDRRPDALDFDRQVFAITDAGDDDSDASADVPTSPTVGPLPPTYAPAPISSDGQHGPDCACVLCSRIRVEHEQRINRDRADAARADADRERRTIVARPISPAPAGTVRGDDDHAKAMRELKTVTDCVRYAWSLGISDSPTELVRWLDGYGVSVSRPTVAGQRPKSDA